jgi:kynurenine formamidase
MVQGVDHCDDRRHQMRPFPVVTCLALFGLLLPLQISGQEVRPLTRTEFDALFEQVDNAGRWGPLDERGTLNLITPEVRRAAASEVQTGITVSLAREMVHGEPEGGFGPIMVDMLVLSDSILGPSDGSVVWALERMSLLYHGWSYTHIDALSHMPSYHGRGYNNAPPAHEPPAGQLRNSVAAMRDGVITRGVLIDLPALRGVAYVAPGGAITAEDFEAWELHSGARIRPGDVVLVRSGRWSAPALAASVAGSAGIHPGTAAWLHARGVAALGDEAGTDTSPTAVEGINAPLHVLALVGMGMPMVENMDLEDLARQAAAHNRWTFLFVLAPLHVRGATGSAVNPIAVF